MPGDCLGEELPTVLVSSSCYRVVNSPQIHEAVRGTAIRSLNESRHTPFPLLVVAP